MYKKSVHIVVGVPGVGKTSICREIAKRYSSVFHVGLGQFVREYYNNNKTSERIGIKSRSRRRTAALGSDCAYAFWNFVRNIKREHVLIDSGAFLTESGLYYSEFYLWELLEPTLLLVVLESPDKIIDRRKNDKLKPRPLHSESLELLHVKQNILIATTASHAAKINIPVAYILNSSLKTAIADFWSAITMCRTAARTRRLLLQRMHGEIN